MQCPRSSAAATKAKQDKESEDADSAEIKPAKP
jgi:hypothetical protein